MARYRVLDYSINTETNSISIPTDAVGDNVILVIDETLWPISGATHSIIRSSGNITHSTVTGKTIYVDSGWCVMQEGDDLRIEVDYGNDYDFGGLAKQGEDSSVTLTSINTQVSGVTSSILGTDSGATNTAILSAITSMETFVELDDSDMVQVFSE